MELIKLPNRREDLANSLIKVSKEQIIDSIGNAIVKVNTILSFKLTDREIFEWALSVYETEPNVSIRHIEFAIYLYQIGDMVWDKYSGIQNLFKSLNETQELFNWVNKLGLVVNTLSEYRMHQKAISLINKTIPTKFQLDEKYKYFRSK